MERGKAAFVTLECHHCHEVQGVELPPPTVQPPVPVVLGGLVVNEVTDGYLTASIVNPSYKLAAYPKELITAGGKSRMPEYADRMTVRQLTDLVAFLAVTVHGPARFAKVTLLLTRGAIPAEH